jgi:hypothetical protein
MSWFRSRGMEWFRSCVRLGPKKWNGMVLSCVRLGELKSRMYTHNTAIYSIDLNINLISCLKIVINNGNLFFFSKSKLAMINRSPYRRPAALPPLPTAARVLPAVDLLLPAADLLLPAADLLLRLRYPPPRASSPPLTCCSASPTCCSASAHAPCRHASSLPPPHASSPPPASSLPPASDLHAPRLRDVCSQSRYSQFGLLARGELFTCKERLAVANCKWNVHVPPNWWNESIPHLVGIFPFLEPLHFVLFLNRT